MNVTALARNTSVLSRSTSSSHSGCMFADKRKYLSFQCSRFMEEHCFIWRFPGFAHLSISWQQHEDERQQWWNDTDRGKPKYSEKTPSQRHFARYKSYVTGQGSKPNLRFLFRNIVLSLPRREPESKKRSYQHQSDSVINIMLYVIVTLWMWA